MDKKQAEKLVDELWQDLDELVQKATKRIAEICDKHGIVKYFTGLPPFDEYGNSGYYLPVKEDGEPWLSSDEMQEYGGYEAEAGNWISSSARC